MKSVSYIAMGNLFGKTKTDLVTSTSETGPWGPQQDYLKTLFSEGNRLYDANKNLGAWNGPRVAGFTPDTNTGFDWTRNFAGGINGAAPGVMNGAQPGLAGLGGATSILDSVRSRFNGDPTSTILGNAARYADNPQIDGMIKASTRDMVRDYRENTVPTLNSVASATGNINSSRAGAAEAIARRGLDDRIGDVSASIRGAAWNNGLATAQGQYNQDFNNAGSMAGAYRDNYGAGLSGLGASTNLAYGAADRMMNIGGAQQALTQAQMDAEKAKWQEGIDNPWQMLSRYQGSISGNYGSTGSQTVPVQSYQPGIGNYLMAGLGGAASIAGLGGPSGFNFWGAKK